MEFTFDAAAILETIADSFFALDSDCRFTFVTATAGELLGTPASQLIGLKFTEALRELENSEFHGSIVRSLAEQTAQRFDQFHSRQGRWFEYQTYPQSGGGLAVAGRDVTKRRRAEMRLRHLVEATKILSSSLNIEKTFHDLAVFLATHVGKSCEIFLKEDDELKRVAAAGYESQPSPVDVTASASMKSVLTKGVPEVIDGLGILVSLPSRGRIAGALFQGLADVPLDYEDLHLMEEIGRRAGMSLENTRLYQETQIASQLKDEFVAALSHELRTPLTPILGAVYMLRSESMDRRSFQKALDLIERNAKTQSRIVGDLLDVSRIISGRLRIRQEPVDLSAALTAALDAIRPAYDAKRITVNVTLNPVNGTIYGDPERLQQIFWNILSNSAKFTPADGQITVSLQHTGDHAEAQISDTGIGIGEEFLPYVFDRFRQADTSRTRIHGGLGVGLAIVRHLVEFHGGTVHAHSLGSNKGSTFIVRLPIRAASNPEIRSRSASVTRES